MTAQAPPPFSRRVDVRSLPSAGLDLTVEADAAERAALAREFDLPAVASLVGAYRVRPSSRGQVVVKGTVRAQVTRVCVVTLEPFETGVEEAVEVVFAPQAARAARGAVTTGRTPDEEIDIVALSTPDPPEPIVDGRIDLGAVTAEFVALGLDPYPRRPGAAFEAGDPAEPASRAFAALAGLAGDKADGKK